MLGVAVGAAVDDQETSADARVDFAADDLAAFGREQEMLRLRGLQPASNTRSGDAAMVRSTLTIAHSLMPFPFDQRLELVEASGPELLPLPQPAFRFLQRLGLQRANLPAPRLLAFDEPRALQHLHVLRSAREGHREGLAKLAHRFVAEGEAGEHPAPGRIGQCPEGRVESLFNHVV